MTQAWGRDYPMAPSAPRYLTLLGRESESLKVETYQVEAEARNDSTCRAWGIDDAANLDLAPRASANTRM